jgi:hypothetical protein
MAYVLILITLTSKVQGYFRNSPLAVEPNVGQNLGFYWKCGFEDTLPSRHVIKRLDTGRHSVKAQPNLRIGSDFSVEEHERLIAYVQMWSQELIPGIDFSRDLAHFLKRYPSRILFYIEQGYPIGFLAYEDSFRTDPWGAVKSIESDNLILKELICGCEVAFKEDKLLFHYHTNFHRLSDIFIQCGYKFVDNKICMVLKQHREKWTKIMTPLVIRPWWS